MAEHVAEIAPFRWKVFQVLIVPGENDSENAIRDARDLAISPEQYQDFCQRHRHVDGFVPESNNLMASSYLILDENMQFLDNPVSGKSESILNVGINTALKQIRWDRQAFIERGKSSIFNLEQSTLFRWQCFCAPSHSSNIYLQEAFTNGPKTGQVMDVHLKPPQATVQTGEMCKQF